MWRRCEVGLISGRIFDEKLVAFVKDRIRFIEKANHERGRDAKGIASPMQEQATTNIVPFYKTESRAHEIANESTHSGTVREATLSFLHSIYPQ